MLLHRALLVPALLVPPLAGASPADPPQAAVPAPAEPAAPHGSDRGRIRGEVGFSRREKVLGATVVLFREEDPSRLVVTSTDEDGIFSVEAIPEGSWSLRILRDGLQPAAKDGIELRAPFRAVTDVIVGRPEGDPAAEPAPLFTLGPVRVEGRRDRAGAGRTDGKAASEDPAGGGRLVVLVRGRDGAPREGARFRLRGLGGGVDPLGGQTGADGALELPAPPAGDYALEIESPGELPIRIARLRISGGPMTVTGVLVTRPYFYPGTPTDLLPEERPLPPSDLRAAPPGPFPGQEPERTAK